ncbi:MAG: MBL fold metallo-hydrolase [Deltaproteobacteria bacterium]|nr:MBL fold metallo-hydrolase [Deltaproteobacteria bacterium]
MWLTHSHFDHCGGVQPIKKRFNGVILKGHLSEKEFRANAGDIAQSWGIPGITSCPEPDEYLNDGDQFDWKGIRISVLFTPGHSPGHLCYYLPEIGVLFCGDTVFSGSIGRTDLPGGNFELLIRSIKDKILILPNETRLLPGHGPDTTVEREKFSNPFLKQ